MTLRERERAAALTGGDFHRFFQRRELRIQRRIDQIAEENDLIDAAALSAAIRCTVDLRSAAGASVRMPSRLSASVVIGRRPGDWPKSKICAEWTPTLRSRAALVTASTRRVLPMPASPRTTMARPCRLDMHRSSDARIIASSGRRPTNG